MRLFFGFELPDSIREIADSAISYLQSYIPTSVNWVESDALHITFQFVGEVKPTEFSAVEEAFLASINECTEQIFTLRHVTCYPLRNPKVIWISLDNENKTLRKSVKNFQNRLKQLGYNVNKKDYQAHITLGRIKGDLMNLQMEHIIKAEVKQEEFSVDEITLFESNLTKKGAIYRALQTYNLKELKET